MTLALFDLDNTLIAGDSDHAWGEFIAERGLVDAEEYARANDRFFEEYRQGDLDIDAYLRFALKPLSQYSMQALNELHKEFMLSDHVVPLWLTAADQLIAKHRDQGHQLVVITATNRFVVEPIVKRLGIHDILCSEPEIINDRYTGNYIEEPCFQDGKVSKLERWLTKNEEDIEGAWFYSDSHNDIPLLEQVDNPVAVDPDPILEAEAQAKGWSIISLRN